MKYRSISGNPISVKANALVCAAFEHSTAVRRAHEVKLTELMSRFEIDAGDPRLGCILKELHTVGYVVFRKAKYAPHILSALDVELELDLKTQEIIPIIKASGLPETGWNLVILNRPLFGRDGQYLGPDSSVARIVPQVLRLAELENNAMIRDKHNRDPGVFTRRGAGVRPSGEAGMGLEQIHNNMLPSNVTGSINYNTFLRKTKEQISNQARITDTIRSRNNKDIETPRRHQEYMVSMGAELTPVHHLHQDPAFMNLMFSKLSDEIFFAMDVPPQAEGKNINSERQAGASRLSEVALVRWERHLRYIGDIIITVYKLLGIKATFNPQFSLFDIHQAETVLKTDVAADMYAGVFNLDKSSIDKKRLADRQDSLIGGPNKREKKSDEEKTEARVERDNM